MGNTLIELAECCEAAAGADRETDFYIWAALNGVTEITNPAEGHPMTPGRGGRVEGIDANGEWHLYGYIDPGKVNRNWTPYGGEDRYPAYTASLDAAMTLAKQDTGAPDVLRHAIERCTRYGAPTFIEALPRFVAGEWLRARAAMDGGSSD